MNPALSDLRRRGFSFTFRLKDDCVYCHDYELGFEDFDILEIHRFENPAPDEYPALYAIKCDKYNIKGVIVNVPNIYSDVFSDVCIGKILNTDDFRYEYQGKER